MYDGVVPNKVPSAAMMVQRLHQSLVYPVPCRILVKSSNTIQPRGPNLAKRSKSPCQIQSTYLTCQMQPHAHPALFTGLIRVVMLWADRYDFFVLVSQTKLNSILDSLSITITR